MKMTLGELADSGLISATRRLLSHHDYNISVLPVRHVKVVAVYTINRLLILSDILGKSQERQ